jgi:hypothetical protein
MANLEAKPPIVTLEDAVALHAQGRPIGAYEPGTPTQHEKEWLQPQWWGGARKGTVVAFRDCGDGGWLIKLEGGIGWEGPAGYELRHESER